MAVPISQMYTVATYVLSQKFKGVKRYPLVLMLEPLFGCNFGLRRLRKDSVSRSHPR
jgi:hypothetical protein